MLKREVEPPPMSVASEFAIATFTAFFVAIAAVLGIINVRDILLSSAPKDRTAERLERWLNNQIDTNNRRN